MVSPLIKVGRRRDRFRRSELIEGTRLQKTPKMTSIGMTIVSPSEPESRLEVISPARKNLFERTPAPSDTIGVVVGIDKSGCSGYSYKIEFANKLNRVKTEKQKIRKSLTHMAFERALGSGRHLSILCQPNGHRLLL